MKLYTRTVCPKCMLVKTMLNGAELEYEVINLDENEEAKQFIKDKGFMAAPILELDGEFLADVSSIQKAISNLAE